MLGAVTKFAEGTTNIFALSPNAKKSDEFFNWPCQQGLYLLHTYTIRDCGSELYVWMRVVEMF